MYAPRGRARAHRALEDDAVARARARASSGGRDDEDGRWAGGREWADDPAVAFDASARRGACAHREGMFLVTFSANAVRVSSIGGVRGVIEEFARDAGERWAAATWREASATGDREGASEVGGWDARVGTGAEERLGTSLATVSEGGEVYVSRCWRATTSGEGGAEVERVIRLDDGERATCCASDDDDIVVGTDRGRVVFLTWAKGDEGRSATIRRSERDGGATSVAWCPDTNTVVMRFDTGSVCAARIDERGEVVARNWFDSFPDPSMCAAFHRGTRRLALGTAYGEVRVYDDAMTSESSKPSLVFGLSAWGFSVDDTGAASYASWSHDGKALAVGWRRRGLSVWSESGCLLMCSLHHQSGDVGARLPSPKTSSSFDDEETPEIGACLCDPAWGVGGYSLYVVTRTASGVQVMEHALARNVPKPRVSPRVSEHAVGDESSLLIGDDRVFIIASNALGKFRIRQEICPQSYVRRRWPMRVAAMSPDGEHIAVAGSRGCVVFDTIREEWSESTSLARENSFEVVDFTWVRPARDSKRVSFLAAVSRLGTARMFTNSMKLSYGLNFFANGGSGSLLATMPLPSEPTHACSCGEFFAVAFANGEIALYEMRLPADTAEGLMSVHPVRESDGRRRQMKLSNSARVSGVCLVNQSERSSEETNGAPSECVVLTEDGEVYLVDLTGSHKQVKIFDKVAEFWVSDRSVLDDHRHVCSDDDDNDASDSDVLPTDRGCIFAYGSEGIRVFYFPEEGLRRVFVDGVSLADVDYATKHSELEFDRELYPLAVSLKLNRIIGAKQKLSFTDSLESPYFMISPSVHTIVPYVLRKLLSSGQFKTALRYARAARRQTPHFTHALEWLLFTALENSSRDVASQDILQQSIALLSELPNYLDIIVSVARKTDNTRWDSLFKYAGKPSDLCIKALESNQTRIAACYILVVDKLEGEDMGRKIAVRVMNRALEAREYRLVEDLIKFLLKPVDASSLPRDENKIEGVFSRMLNVIAPRPKNVVTVPERGEDAFALDDSEQELLKSHLDSLAQDKDVVSMGAFISNTSFDGVSYMKHETDHRGGAYIADFADAVESAARCLREKKSIRRAASTRSPRSESLVLIDSTLEDGSKSDATYVAELLDVALEAECTDWSLLLATVLGRVDILSDCFDKQPELRAPWLNIAKQSVKKSSDPALVHHLNALVSDVERVFTAAA